MLNVYLYVCLCVHINKIVCRKIDDHRLATFICCYCLECGSWNYLQSVRAQCDKYYTALTSTVLHQFLPFLCWRAACRPPENWLETHWTDTLFKKESSSCSLWITSLADWNALLYLAGQHLLSLSSTIFAYCPFSNPIKIFQW